jgi:hypothetical protein
MTSMSEGEADSVLDRLGFKVRTPGGWGTWPDERKRRGLAMALADASNDDLRLLQNYCDSLSAVLDLDEPPVMVEAPEVLNAIDASDVRSQLVRVLAGDGSIFVVHGHDHAALHETVRVLERATGRDVVVLHEQANAGRTILEKFEEHAAQASYAVILATGDDEGGSRTGTAKPRARQNVVFELGFFFGCLGRNRVAVLLESGVEKPSDIDGLVYIGIDPGGAWKHQLARELAAAGIPVDYGRIP